ncbi:hypothetical protein NHX12_024629 [Muraenolepis orangiensis]|uniref:Cyclin N-terminal domain-containing protein 1 n=1 Tax=Muraenolepis orangiensis TaxID=630683 RepID=A0A9Q0ELF5_9TELE|nr:hypothetical protein NHX12_024629 [Muraenolepis orangiensis]
MAVRLLGSWAPRLRFGGASPGLLSDLLTHFNDSNRLTLDQLSACCGAFRHSALTECVFLMTRALRLDPLVGFSALEIVERFMVQHLQDLFTTSPRGPAGDYQDLLFEKLRDKFPLTVFSCVQISSKLWLHSEMIDNNTAVQFLHSMGLTVSKKALMASELEILKGLHFNLNVPNPLSYVEVLLEVLGHNESSTPVEPLYDVCVHVLQLACLQRTSIYQSLLQITVQSLSPTPEQREKFLTVTADCMLLATGVITVATVVLKVRRWEQVVEELVHITGISWRSIGDLSQVMLEHITGNTSPV